MKCYWHKDNAYIYNGDCLGALREMPSERIHCCVTSPPYWGLRDYGVNGQLGTERTPDEYVARLVEIFREIRRVLRKDGTCWLNLGDSYANDGKWGGETGGKQAYLPDNDRKRVGRERRHIGLKPKDLCGIPWRVAFALQADGWWLRQDIIWHKPNPMPESVRDRCTKAHEYIFLLTKSARYWYDADAIAEPLKSDPNSWGRHSKKDPGAQAVSPRPIFRNGRDGTGWGNGKTRNRRSVWTVTTQAYPEAHFATYPPKLIEPCILAGCPENGVVLDPFCGSGTTGDVAVRHGRHFIGIELNEEYCALAKKRIGNAILDVSGGELFAQAGA